MTGLRHHISRHRPWAAWLVALALAVRVMVPTGYMPDVRDGRITVRLCDGAGSVPTQLTLPSLDRHHGDHQNDTASQPCAFAAATIAGIDTIATIALAPPVLPPAIVNRLALARAPPLAGQRRLRPPSQAPPLNG